MAPASRLLRSSSSGHGGGGIPIVAADPSLAPISEQSPPVQYLRSTFIPGEEKCFCLFEGPSAEVVRTANDRAQLPYERIVEAQHIAADDLA